MTARWGVYRARVDIQMSRSVTAVFNDRMLRHVPCRDEPVRNDCLQWPARYGVCQEVDKNRPQRLPSMAGMLACVA